MKTVLVRADGSTEIGLGHIMRCLTLAGALRKMGADVQFVTKRYSDAVFGQISKARFDCRVMEPGLGLTDDLKFTASAAKDFGAQVVVCDGYAFDEAYYVGISKAGFRLTVIDDLADRRIPADIVLNQNVYAEAGLYEGLTGTGTVLLLGTLYCLLREEFRLLRNALRDTRGGVREVLVSLGGSDPDGLTLVVLKALDNVSGDFRVTAVLGAATPERVIGAARDYIAGSGRNIELVVNASKMAELMARADLGITASGSTSYETACLGLPAISMAVANNQEGVGAGMLRLGAAVYLGRACDITENMICGSVGALIDSPDKRTDMSFKGMSLVDGEGAARVAEIIVNGHS